eukprot:g12257.t1
MRYHPTLGLVIENLTGHDVTDIADIQRILDYAFKRRAASGSSGEQSSRQHHCLTLVIERYARAHLPAPCSVGAGSCSPRSPNLRGVGSDAVFPSRSRPASLSPGAAGSPQQRMRDAFGLEASASVATAAPAAAAQESSPVAKVARCAPHGTTRHDRAALPILQLTTLNFIDLAGFDAGTLQAAQGQKDQSGGPAAGGAEDERVPVNRALAHLLRCISDLPQLQQRAELAKASGRAGMGAAGGSCASPRKFSPVKDMLPSFGEPPPLPGRKSTRYDLLQKQAGGVDVEQLVSGGLFREHKLTMLLAHALGGNCRTTVLATVEVGDDLLALQRSLRIAESCRGIRTHTTPNAIRDFPDHDSLLDRLFSDMRILQKQLQRGGNGGRMTNDHVLMSQLLADDVLWFAERSQREVLRMGARTVSNRLPANVVEVTDKVPPEWLLLGKRTASRTTSPQSTANSFEVKIENSVHHNKPFLLNRHEDKMLDRLLMFPLGNERTTVIAWRPPSSTCSSTSRWSAALTCRSEDDYIVGEQEEREADKIDFLLPMPWSCLPSQHGYAEESFLDPAVGFPIGTRLRDVAVELTMFFDPGCGEVECFGVRPILRTHLSGHATARDYAEHERTEEELHRAGKVVELLHPRATAGRHSPSEKDVLNLAGLRFELRAPRGHCFAAETLHRVRFDENTFADTVQRFGHLSAVELHRNPRSRGAADHL